MRSWKYLLSHKTWKLRSVTWCSDTDVPRSSNNTASAVFFLLHSYMLPCISKDIHGSFKFIAFLFSNPRGKELLFQLHREGEKEVCEPARVAWDYGDLSQAQVQIINQSSLPQSKHSLFMSPQRLWSPRGKLGFYC